MVKKLFPYEAPFINRQKETKYLTDYFSNQPTSMLFVYGPKSTGKTTLITRVYESLPQDEYAISYLDMRRVLIKDFSDFQNVFFPLDRKGKIKKIVSGIQLNMGFFGWSIDDEKMLQTNLFAVMENKLREAQINWIKPVIIIDEFQYLKNIIIDKEHNLLLVEELWKFFIAMTKVTHLAHIVCLTSDSYYIEELYAHTKLKNTSKFFLVDHISYDDVAYRLGQTESLSADIVQYFWDHLWWSVREIRQALIDYKNTDDYITPIQTMISDEYGKIAEYYNINLSLDEQKDFLSINKKIVTQWEYLLSLGENYSSLIKKLVDMDIWFYDVRHQRITANSQSIRKAFEILFE